MSAYDAQVLTQSRRLAELFEAAVVHYPHPKPVANWIMGEMLSYVNAHGQDPDKLIFRPEWLTHLLEAVDKRTISGTMAKELFVASLTQQRDPAELIAQQGLRQIVDEDALGRLADEVIAAHAASVQDYAKGKVNALMFLVGQCMQRSQGKANPQHVTDILKRKLDAGKEAIR